MVNQGKWRIQPRDKNRKLLVDYIIDEKRIEKELLELEVCDFCKAKKNNHPKYPDEVIYFFGKDIQLIPRFGGQVKLVSIYI